MTGHARRWSAYELAYRTAMTAAAFADTLSADCIGIAQALKEGEVATALESLETGVDRMQRFLTFVVIASELLCDEGQPVGAVLADYGRRVLELVGQVDKTLCEGDLFGVTLVLEHGLGGTLGDYARYDQEIRRALAARRQAAA